jgi:uncharacterized protein YegL
MAEQVPFGDVALAWNPEPRCPCVLLLDTSASMGQRVANADGDSGVTYSSGGDILRFMNSRLTRIDLLNEGLRTYQTELMSDSLAAQRVEVCVITFGGKVQTLVPFVPAYEFTPPTLTAEGDTPMGQAILQAIEGIEQRKRLYRQNGLHYFRPWIFLITDGQPTDAWQSAAEQVRLGEKQKKFAFFAVGVAEANFEILRNIAVREPLPLKGYSFREMFIWLSQSQRCISHSSPGQEGQVKLDSPAGWASL